MLLSLTGTTGQTLHVLLADVIPWINVSLVLHACMLRAMPQPTGSSKALSSSSLVIEICHCQGRESVSNSISHQLCTLYIDNHLLHEQCSYWGCGQVFHNQNNIHWVCNLVLGVTRVEPRNLKWSNQGGKSNSFWTVYLSTVYVSPVSNCNITILTVETGC